MTSPLEPLPRLLAFPPFLYLTAFALGWLLHWLAPVLSFLLNAAAPLVLFLPVFAVVDRRVIRWEERHLAAKFGAPYLAYLSRVPRWF